jgi:hypothetical protein
MSTPIAKVYDFLDYTVNKSFFNTNTAGSRKTACRNLFDILDENEQTVEYVTANLDSVVHRFNNRNKEKFTGQTVEVYKSRVKSTLDDYLAWTNDKAAWERSVIGRSKQTSSKPKEEKASQKKQPKGAASTPETPFVKAQEEQGSKRTRLLSFPIRPDFEVKVEIPAEGLTSLELKRLGYFLLPYCSDISAENWNAADWGLVLRKDH